MVGGVLFGIAGRVGFASVFRAPTMLSRISADELDLDDANVEVLPDRAPGIARQRPRIDTVGNDSLADSAAQSMPGRCSRLAGTSRMFVPVFARVPRRAA